MPLADAAAVLAFLHVNALALIALGLAALLGPALWQLHTRH